MRSSCAILSADSRPATVAVTKPFAAQAERAARPLEQQRDVVAPDRAEQVGHEYDVVAAGPVDFPRVAGNEGDTVGEARALDIASRHFDHGREVQYRGRETRVGAA